MTLNDQDGRKSMDPWKGPHELPKSLKGLLAGATSSGLLLWMITCLHAIAFIFSLDRYTVATQFDLNVELTQEEKGVLNLTAFPSYFRVIVWLQFIQGAAQCFTLIFPCVGIAASLSRKVVMYSTLYVRFLTSGALVASGLRLFGFRQEGTAALQACVATQIRLSANAAVDAATATPLCKASMAWIQPVEVIGILIDVGCMLFFFRNILKYERKLLAERYPAYSQGFLLHVPSSSDHNRVRGTYAPLPLDVDEKDDEDYEKRK